MNESHSAYAFAYGGFSFDYETDSSIQFPFFLGNINAGTETDGGYIIGAGLGIKSCFLGGTRFEIEGLHSSNDLETLTLSAPGAGAFTANVNGDIEIKATYVNLVKEIPLGCITGYAGAGFGVATTEFNLRGPLGFGITGEDTSLAYQFKIGADMPVADKLSIFGEYKLIGVTETDYSAIILPIDTDGFITHNIVFGARLHF